MSAAVLPNSMAADWNGVDHIHSEGRWDGEVDGSEWFVLALILIQCTEDHVTKQDKYWKGQILAGQPCISELDGNRHGTVGNNQLEYGEIGGANDGKQSWLGVDEDIGLSVTNGVAWCDPDEDRELWVSGTQLDTGSFTFFFEYLRFSFFPTLRGTLLVVNFVRLSSFTLPMNHSTNQTVEFDCNSYDHNFFN